MERQQERNPIVLPVSFALDCFKGSAGSSAKQEIPVKVLDGQIEPARVAPGEEAVGVVALQSVSGTHPTILRFQFPTPKQSGDELSDDRRRQIDAFLVR